MKKVKFGNYQMNINDILVWLPGVIEFNSCFQPFDPWEWLVSYFSLQYHPWITH